MYLWPYRNFDFSLTILCRYMVFQMNYLWQKWWESRKNLFGLQIWKTLTAWILKIEIHLRTTLSSPIVTFAFYTHAHSTILFHVTWPFDYMLVQTSILYRNAKRTLCYCLLSSHIFIFTVLCVLKFILFMFKQIDLYIMNCPDNNINSH